MARRKTATVTRKQDVVVVTPPAAPITRTRRRRAPAKRRRTTRRRTTRVGAGSVKNVLMGSAMGGFAYGFIEKNWGAQIPKLPFVGKSGAIALGCYFLAPRHPVIRDIGIAAAAIAGYSFGKTGVVSGDVVGDDDFDGLEQS